MYDVKEEIKSRLSVEDVVGRYVELKRAGRNLKGFSPWGNERTPSFMVSPEKGIWHDFSANKGGDIFTFMMEIEGLSFKEALEKLANQAGVELKMYQSDQTLNKRKKRAKEILELATRYFQVSLTKNKQVAEYVFYRRNLNKNTVREFRIGYAPQGGRVLVDFLERKGYQKTEIADAGLTTRFGGDLFKGRMTVPFIDTNDQVIGFTGRILDDKDKNSPKYLNTPETILFNKSRFIFGLAQAKESIRKSKFVVIVEGNMDVISSHQAGVKQAVATSGTAMTTEQLKMLARLTDDIRLAYDGDSAGIAAAERAIMMGKELNINLSVISDYHGAKDPDDLIQKSPELWQSAVKNTMPATEWLLKEYETRFNLRTPTGKKEYSTLAAKLLNLLADPVEKESYEQAVARRLDISLEALRAKKLEPKKPKYLKKPEHKPTKTPKVVVLEQNILAILRHGDIDVKNLDIPDSLDDNKDVDLSLIYEYRYAKLSKEDLAKELSTLTQKLNEEKLWKQKSDLTKRLESAKDETEEMQILTEIDKLNGRR